MSQNRTTFLTKKNGVDKAAPFVKNFLALPTFLRWTKNVEAKRKKKNFLSEKNEKKWKKKNFLSEKMEKNQ